MRFPSDGERGRARFQGWTIIRQVGNTFPCMERSGCARLRRIRSMTSGVDRIDWQMRRVAGERAEKVLRRSASLTRDTFDVAPVAMIQCTPESEIRRANGAARDMLGSLEHPVFKVRLSQHVHPDDLEAFEELRNVLLRGGRTSVSGEFRFVAADGRMVWGSTSARWMGNRHSDARLLLWAILDVSRQKFTEAALRDSEARFRSLVSLSSDWYWEQDENLRFVGFSNHLAHMSSQESDKVGMTRWEIPSVGLSQDQKDAHTRVLEARLPFRGLEFGRTRPDGGTQWLSISGEPFFDAHGRFLGYRGIGRDITQHKKTEEDLRARQDEVRRLNADLERRVEVRTADLVRVNKELEAFSFSVSHDLRVPLRAISGFARLLKDEAGPALPASAAQWLDRILGSCERMGMMIARLLELNRLGRSVLGRRRVDLSELAGQTFESQHRDNPGRTVISTVEPGIIVNADPVLLMVLLENVIGNAWKYTERRQVATIHVGAGADAGGRVHFYVRDNGAGFDMAHADRLFKIFQRLHSRKEFEGDGIGLATVRQIVERHGGTVWAESRPDEGATFFFSLPEQ